MKKLLAIMLSLVMLSSIFSGSVYGALSAGVQYIDENGDTRYVTETVTPITRDMTTLTDGWYIAEGTIYMDYRFVIDAKNEGVNIILKDGSHLYARAGINVENENKLNIYSQSKGSNEGKFTGTLGYFDMMLSQYTAVIGGNGSYEQVGNTAGIITINGGIINVSPSNYGAAIGGGGSYKSNAGNGGAITINGGTINVTPTTSNAAVIGGGGSQNGDAGNGGIITFNGGTINANARTNSTAIGGGSSFNGNGGSSGNITINNGQVNAVSAGSNSTGAGIGGGFSSSKNGGSVDSIIINGGEVKATVTGTGTAIGGGGSATGKGGSGGTITISGGIINANVSGNTPAIGGGKSGNSSEVNHGDFTTGDNGAAIIYTNKIGDRSHEDEWSGIIFEKDNTNKIIYPAEFTLNNNYTVPESYHLDVNEDRTLIIPKDVTLTHQEDMGIAGRVIVNGKLKFNKSLNIITGAKLTVNGILEGDSSKIYIDADVDAVYGKPSPKFDSADSKITDLLPSQSYKIKSGTDVTTLQADNEGKIDIDKNWESVIEIARTKPTELANVNIADSEFVKLRIKPIIVKFPTSEKITYGQKLSDTVLTGGDKEYGTFAWELADTVPTAGTHSDYEVVFTPNQNSIDEYGLQTQKQKVAVEVEKTSANPVANTSLTGNSQDRTATIKINLDKTCLGNLPTGQVELVDVTSSDLLTLDTLNLSEQDGKATATYTWNNLKDQDYTIKVNYLGDGNYLPTETEHQFNASKKSQENLEIAETGDKVYKQELTLSTTGGTGAGQVTYTSSDEDVLSIQGDKAILKKAGTVTIKATKQEDEEYNPITTTKEITINKKDITVIADNKQIEQGENLPTLTIKDTLDLAQGDSITSENLTTVSNTDNAGEFEINVVEVQITDEQGQDVTSNYNVTKQSGKLIIKEKVTTPTPNPQTPNKNNGNSSSSSNSGSSSSGGGGSSDRDRDSRSTTTQSSQTTSQSKSPNNNQDAVNVNETNIPLEQTKLSEKQAQIVERLKEIQKTTQTQEVEYTDIQNHWARQDIQDMVNMKLQYGVDDKRFKPNDKITRGMFVTILSRIKDIQKDKYQDKIFEDVEQGKYYQSAVNWAKQNKIANGISENKFAPDSQITREQIAVMIVNFAKYIGYDLDGNTQNLPKYQDEHLISGYALESVNMLRQSGLMTGDENGRFNPKGYATRAEVSSVLNRMIKMMMSDK